MSVCTISEMTGTSTESPGCASGMRECRPGTRHLKAWSPSDDKRSTCYQNSALAHPLCQIRDRCLVEEFRCTVHARRMQGTAG